MIAHKRFRRWSPAGAVPQQIARPLGGCAASWTCWTDDLRAARLPSGSGFGGIRMSHQVVLPRPDGEPPQVVARASTIGSPRPESAVVFSA